MAFLRGGGGVTIFSGIAPARGRKGDDFDQYTVAVGGDDGNTGALLSPHRGATGDNDRVARLEATPVQPERHIRARGDTHLRETQPEKYGVPEAEHLRRTLDLAAREPPCLLTNAGIFLLPLLIVFLGVVADQLTLHYAPQDVRIVLRDTGIGPLLGLAVFVAAVGSGLYFLWSLPFSYLAKCLLSLVYTAVMVPLLILFGLTVLFALFGVYF